MEPDRSFSGVSCGERDPTTTGRAPGTFVGSDASWTSPRVAPAVIAPPPRPRPPRRSGLAA